MLPNRQAAPLPDDKRTEPLLNPDHEQANGKSQFFIRRFSEEGAEQWREALLHAPGNRS